MTGPVMLPGWGQSLGNAASAVGQGIQQVVDPNYQFQQQFQKALADPQLAQQYANMYSTNPSIFDPKLYGQKNVLQLSQIKPDPNYQFQQQTQADARNAYNDPNNPSTKQNYIAKQLGVPNPTQQTVAANEATESTNAATNSTDALKARQAQIILSQASPQMQEQLLNDSKFSGTLGMTPEQLIALKNHIHGYNSQQEVNSAADKWLAANPNALNNPSQIAKDILDGKIDALTAGALQTDPKYAAGINPAIQAEQHNRDITAAANSLTQKGTTAENVANIKASATVQAAQAKGSGDDFVKTYLNVVRQLDDTKNPISPEQAMQFAPLLQDKINKAWTAATGSQEGAPLIGASQEPTGLMGKILGHQGRVTITYTDKDGNNLVVKDPKQLLPPASATPKATGITPQSNTDPTVSRAIQIIDSKKGTIQQLMASPTWKQLSPQQQQAIQSHYQTPSGGNE